MSRLTRRRLLMTLGPAFILASVIPANAQVRPPASTRSGRTGTSAPARTRPAMQSKAVQRSRQYGGHLNEHVGQSRSALAARAARKEMRLNFETARLGVKDRRSEKAAIKDVPKGYKTAARKARRDLRNYNMSPKQTSTFASAREADAMYARALRQHRPAIRNWLKTPPAKRREFEATFDAGAKIGTVYSRKSNTYSPATKGVFYLKTAPGTNRVYPVSAKMY